MFKFNFDIDDPQDNGLGPILGPDTHSLQIHRTIAAEHSSSEVSLGDLLSSLPHTISFSPLNVSLPSGQNVALSRRDLFDARFQLISDDDAGTSGTGTSPSEVEFVDAPSDLVPGVYEGGLKTWECSLDLVTCLASIYGPQIAIALGRKRILELGCGTAAPSLYFIHSIFSAEPTADAGIHVHLQDYNELVLRLVTVPNIILAWCKCMFFDVFLAYILVVYSIPHLRGERIPARLYRRVPFVSNNMLIPHLDMSPASSAYRAMAPSQASEQANDDDDDRAPLPPTDPSQPGELSLTPRLKAAFLESLKIYGIHLKVFSGSWATFDVERAGGPYDILLTSETIYRTASLHALVDLMRRASIVAMERNGSVCTRIEEATSRLSLRDSQRLEGLAEAPYLCLVAAKLVYFGVGGGVNEFIQAVESEPADSDAMGGERSRGRVQTIWETSKGVKRSIMRVLWGS